MTASRDYRTARVVGLLALAGCLLLAAAHRSLAGPMPKYTGYTRPGHRPVGQDGKELPAADGAARAVGVTIYYAVYDRKLRRVVAGDARVVEGDTFGVGTGGFDALFVPGIDSDARKLDTEARYLYLYQMVNDSGRKASAYSATVRLLVEPRYITSWGHFARAVKGEKGLTSRQGLGFTTTTTKKGKAEVEEQVIRPISTEHPGVGAAARAYTDQAPPVEATRPFGVAPIAVGIRPAAGSGEDLTREPDAVLFVRNVDFGAAGEKDDAAYWRHADGAEWCDRGLALGGRPLWVGLDDEVLGRPRARDARQRRWPGVRAYFRREPVGPRQRTTLFGFTSDLPPVFAATQVAATSLGAGAGAVGAAEEKFDLIRLADDDSGAADRARDVPLVRGTVPTPFGRPIVPAADVGGVAGLVGGLGGLAPSGGGGFGGIAPPAPFFPPRSAGGFGGGSGFGGGGGFSGSGQQNGGQGQGQSQGGTSFTNNVTVSVQQEQRQQQAQAQGQSQSQKGGPSNVIPAPAAWLLGLLGLPVFGWIAYRRRQKGRGDAPPAAAA